MTYKAFLNDYVKPEPHAVFDRALQNLGILSKELGETLKVSNNYIVFDKNDEQALYVLGELEKMKYIKNVASYARNIISCNITSKGWERISALSKTTTDSNQVFVAMWFSKKMNNIVEKKAFKMLIIAFLHLFKGSSNFLILNL
ncbi:MAG: hypothetical protein U9O87_07440 [Verrucomicrobiota bacterium]|nr:hypothetical protein [Verrucomicrobiota bacterium]